VLLQHWRRHGETFERVHFGDGPVHSPVLDAWILARDGHLVFSDDREGERPWVTETEQERAEKEWERAERERERAERIALEQELVELRARAKG
jgi:hypothetical protein